MKTISFKNNDYSRILLTEILPYEVPLIFSNHGFFQTYNSFKNGHLHKDLKGFFDQHITSRKFKIPFDYKAMKASGDRLKLSIMHPSCQVAFIDFYKSYDSLIASLCQRSPFSLRYPASPQAALMKKQGDEDVEGIPLRGATIDLEADNFEPENMYPRSYFVYKKYGMLYKFYDSYEYQRLEKRFSCYMKFDVAKCFHHIYTHTIGWAVKDKLFAKTNKSDDAFDCRFDKLMQNANYNETNGILVGPEISRIFAEIILQKVDSNVESSLRPNLLSGRDYAVRRYVDDHFVFANSKEALDLIKKTYSDHLEQYRLYINDKKTERGDTPATTGITVAKIAISAAITDFFSSIGQFEEECYLPKGIGSASKVSRRFIQRLKAIAHSAGAEFHTVSGLALATMQKKLQRIAAAQAKTTARHLQERTATVFVMALDVMSYITAMDMRVRASLVFSQTCLMIRECIKAYNSDICSLVIEKITDELSLLIQKQNLQPSLGIEKINLILALRDISPEFFYSDSTCRRILDLALTPDGEEKLGYFQVIMMLYCFRGIDQFVDHRASLVSYACSIFKSEDAPLDHAEYLLLLLDMLSCPYLGKADKESLFQDAVKGAFTDIAFYVKRLGDLKWFTSWDEPNIERILKRKALHPAYDS